MIPEAFICGNCLASFPPSERASSPHEICIGCYQIEKAVEKNACLKCGGPNPTKAHWGLCNQCIDNKRDKINAKKKYKPKMENSQ